MKKLFLGIVIGLFVSPGMGDIADIMQYHYPNNKIIHTIESKTIVPRLGFSDIFTKNCTKDVSQNGFEWVFVNREYFKCGKIAIWLSDKFFGEYAEPRNLELEKKACKGCTL